MTQPHENQRSGPSTMRLEPDDDAKVIGLPAGWDPVRLNGGIYIGPIAHTISVLYDTVGQVDTSLSGIPLSPAGLRSWEVLSACLEHVASDLRDLVAYLQDLEEVERDL